MDTSKLNQSELKYSCSAGGASVNLYTGRLFFEHPDVSIGANGYEIGVSHIYNSQIELPSSIRTYMGNGWKLNIHQYIFLENNKYVYLDGTGYKHVFECLEGNKYYDTSGLGLILTVNLTTKIIADDFGNQMVFQDERLIMTQSCQNINIKKYYNYNSSGKLISIYDGRKTDTQITFDYDSETGLLKTIKCKNNLFVKKLFNYYYDEYSNLFKITKTSDTITQNVALFGYTNGKMAYAVSLEDLSTLKFNYIEDKISKVSTGVASVSTTYSDQKSIYPGDDLYCVDNVFCGETEPVPYYNISVGVETLDVDKITHNEFEYNTRNTIVTNEKAVKVVYYFNEKGFTASILEAYDQNTNNLRSLEKIPGVLMISQGVDDPESINTQRANVWSTDTDISTENLMKSKLGEMRNYRQSKCPDYVNYTCSFWLKLNHQIENSKIKIIVHSYDNNNPQAEESIASFDKSAVGSWQLISIPIRIPYEYLNWIQMQFLERNPEKTIKIADMRLCYSPTSRVCLTNGTNWRPLDDIKKIKYYTAYNSEVIKDINDDFYISENDLAATYLSLFKERVKKLGNNPFVLSCCDKSKKILVNSAKLCIDDTCNEGFNIEFGNDDYWTGTRAQFFTELKSPDGDLYTYMFLHFFNNMNIGNNQSDCICQITEANKFRGAPEQKISHTRSYIDMQGKVLMEQDEYEVQTLYGYDANGILSSKTIQHKDTEEKITFTTNTTAIDKSETDYRSNTKSYYNEPFGYVEKIEYNGKDEDGSNTLTTNLGYNLHNDALMTIGNDIETGGKNYLRHNCYGRLLEVTPIGWNSNDMYGFRFGYNVLGEPCNFYLTYKEEGQIKQDSLIDKIISHTNGTVTTMQYRNKNKEFPDISMVTLDEYGRTEAINEGGKTTTFKRQILWESKAAQEVTEMYDPYENRTYLYSYDDFNRLTGYEIKNGDSNGTSFFAIKASGVGETEYKGLKIPNKTLIKYSEDILIKPRVGETNDTWKTVYYYDELGRIKGKRNHINGLNSTMSVLDENYTYLPGTFLKKNMRTKVYYPYLNPPYYEEYSYDYSYDKRGNIVSNILTKNVFTQADTLKESINYFSINYTYDRANRIKTEKIGNNELKSYSYNKDGSIDSVSSDSYETKYAYNKGRLVSFRTTAYDTYTECNFEYDNLGNCIKYMSENMNMEWERGNLLKRYTNGNLTTTYSYNNQGIRFKKELSGGNPLC